MSFVPAGCRFAVKKMAEGGDFVQCYLREGDTGQNHFGTAGRFMYSRRVDLYQ